jgi:hypothetical protein
MNSGPEEEAEIEEADSEEEESEEEVKMNFNVPVPVPVRVGAPRFKMNLQIDTDMINEEVPVTHASPDSNIEIEDHNNVNEQVDNYTMDKDSGIPDYTGVDDNTQIDGQIKTNVTYPSETSANDQNTSITYVSSADNSPVPVQVPAPVAAEANINTNDEIPGTSIE